jgi:hypothetical protein
MLLRFEFEDARRGHAHMAMLSRDPRFRIVKDGTGL